MAKVQPKLRPKVERMGYYSSSSWVQTSYNQNTAEYAEPEDEEGPNFELLASPTELDKLEVIYEIQEQVSDSDVSKKATKFLIDVHMSLDSSMEPRRSEFCHLLLNRCISRMAGTTETKVILRNIQILEQLIVVSESKGLAGVKPHKALLQGEVFDRLIIKN